MSTTYLKMAIGIGIEFCGFPFRMCPPVQVGTCRMKRFWRCVFAVRWLAENNPRGGDVYGRKHGQFFLSGALLQALPTTQHGEKLPQRPISIQIEWNSSEIVFSVVRSVRVTQKNSANCRGVQTLDDWFKSFCKTLDNEWATRAQKWTFSNFPENQPVPTFSETFPGTKEWSCGLKK